MAAIIRSTILATPGGSVVGLPLTSQSREDIVRGNQIVLESVDAATTYAWTISFKPESTGGGVDPTKGTDSSATFLAPEGSTSSTAKFNFDYEGAYLIRLVVDAGLPSESTQYIRARVLTAFAGLRLVAAGERRDGNGPIPVDADAEGWSNDQNRNLQRLALLTRRTLTSGRVLFVDANRGRDNFASQNDPTNLIDFPGTVASDLTNTGLQTPATSFGDFSAISDAIAYAMDYAARGEPAPSFVNPYFVMVQPGVYVENLILQSHVHIIGLGAKLNPKSLPTFNALGDVTTASTLNVQVTPTNAGGLTHTYNPGANPTTAALLLENIILNNSEDTTTAVLSHQGGLLCLKDVAIYQHGADASQGPALESVASTLTPRPALFVENCAFIATSAPALVLDAPKALWEIAGSSVSGVDGILCNENLYGGLSSGDPTDNVLTLDACQVVATTGYALRGCPVTLQLRNSRLTADTDSRVFVYDGFGAGPRLGDIVAEVSGCDLSGDLILHVTVASGSSTLLLGNTRIGGALSFPSGAPSSLSAGPHGKTLGYQEDYLNPVTGSAVIPVASRLGVNSVQDAIDRLILALFPSGVAPFVSLESAYNGLSSLAPPVAGAGLGRVITADDGAVRITQAFPPVGPAISSLDAGNTDGGLEVEGDVFVGALSSGDDSEITLRPNPTGTGPSVTLGRYNVTTDAGATLRGINAGTVKGSMSSVGDYPYHLRLKTHDSETSGASGLGHVILDGGLSLPPSSPGAGPDGGSIYLEAGDYRNSTAGGVAGDVVLVPGHSDVGADPTRRVVYVNPAASTPTTLVAANAFVGGVDGECVIATPNGHTTISVGSGDNLAAVVALFDAIPDVDASISGGTKLALTTVATGVNADLHFVGDSVAGALNTALGDLTISGGAAYTQGTYPESVGVSCPTDGVLQVHGTIVSSGVSGNVVRVAIDLGDSAYSLVAGVSIVGVDTTTGPGPIIVNLPDAVLDGGEDGRMIYINDEGNNASAVNISIEIGAGGRINLGAGPLLVATDGGGAILYCAGDTGGQIDWFSLP